MNPTIYIAAAIDHVKHGDLNPFELLQKKVEPLQCFNPMAAFAGDVDRSNPNAQEFIIKTNMAAIKNSDVLLVYTDLKKCSFGMPMEILYAANQNKAVVLVLPDDVLFSSVGVYPSFFATHKISLSDLNAETVKRLYGNSGWTPANKVAYDLFQEEKEK